ncbi:MAG: tRNA (adenosine(37)-N6)-threonylcarbamoyltransferase complex ATPase subunit type 1 TsaE [Cellvibrio sp. 79]|nr:MAG: tRNA (adenosine(37)-N6)-threonylcarbamoyltransferase complex ATPase subunit type 1 TsaE [Cellvibrio sp. 79]
MIKREFQIDDDALMVAFGERLGHLLAASEGAISVYLQGDLGAGKTTLSRGILRAFGHAGAVKSPTYTLVEPYEFTDRILYHFDLYRLGDPEELEYMGIRDYFLPPNICLIEWPERGAGLLPEADISLHIEVVPVGRVIHLQSRLPLAL